jgi:pyrroloquinoline quinone biosynthesis protein D
MQPASDLTPARQGAPHALARAWGSSMSTGRRRRNVATTHKHSTAGASPARVQLAPGVRLDGGANAPGVAPVLVSPNGDVQLNDGAAAILKLCDGSRDRDHIVAAIVEASRTRTMAADVLEFLDVARARGWIIEG